MKIIKCDMCQDYYIKSDFEIMDEYVNCCKHCVLFAYESVNHLKNLFRTKNDLSRMYNQKKSKNFPNLDLHFPELGYAESDEHFKKRILKEMKTK
jgi:hypothetical protein